MAALRCERPRDRRLRGPMLAGRLGRRAVDLISVFEGVGAVRAGG